MPPAPAQLLDPAQAYANTALRPTPLTTLARPPSECLCALAGAYARIVEAWSCSVADVIRLTTLAAELVGLYERAPAVCLGMSRYVPLKSPTLRHGFGCALIGLHLARACRLDVRRQLTVIKAALFMNLPALELQDDLVAPHAQPSRAQRLALRQHPRLAADLLRDSPGADLPWIEAVEQHHEALDGSGYPHGLSGEDICFEARILRVVDAWCALVAPQRLLRLPKTPRAALHWLLSQQRQCFDAFLLEMLRRSLGPYPPGTLVRLANRETAIVIDLPRHCSAPRRVISFLGPHGRLFRDPVQRETRHRRYAIRGVALHKSLTLPLSDWNGIWAYLDAANESRR